MNQVVIANHSQSFRIKFSDIRKMDTYYKFQLSIVSSVFHVSTTAYSSIEEWRCWEENLKAMAERKVRTILFAPLGEFWNFHFELKNRNSISVKGSISDLEKQQSSLDFEEDIDIENLQESIRCIC